ncbi:HU family DNA-binding protein [Paenibacillus sp. GCM10027627]|uniref:HU family DNA-binding protein n=1 Tax=unclassified Paenibacillus TaxID=185978 RepID=UPI003635461F
MNKNDLVNTVSEQSGISKKDSEKVVETVFEVIAQTLASGENVKLVGFGNFEVRERAARKGRNPQSGEEIDIAETKVPAFKASKQLKKLVSIS